MKIRTVRSVGWRNYSFEYRMLQAKQEYQLFPDRTRQGSEQARHLRSQGFPIVLQCRLDAFQLS